MRYHFTTTSRASIEPDLRHVVVWAPFASPNRTIGPLSGPLCARCVSQPHNGASAGIGPVASRVLSRSASGVSERHRLSVGGGPDSTAPIRRVRPSRLRRAGRPIPHTAQRIGGTSSTWMAAHGFRPRGPAAGARRVQRGGQPRSSPHSLGRRAVSSASSETASFVWQRWGAQVLPIGQCPTPPPLQRWVVVHRRSRSARARGARRRPSGDRA